MVDPSTERCSPSSTSNSSLTDNAEQPPTKKVKQSSGTSIATSKSSDDSNNDDATRGTKGGSQGTLSSMFGKQQASIQKDLDFVMKNAPLNRSRQLGYFVMQEHITTISAEMIAASEDGDFNLAQTKKDNLDELVKEASMEYKLYHLCTMTKEHATRKLEYHKKKLNFRECGKYQALVNVATEYLSSVPDEDVEGFETQKNAQKCPPSNADAEEVEYIASSSSDTDSDWDWDPEDASDSDEMRLDDDEENLLRQYNDGGRNIVYTLEDGNVDQLMKDLEDSNLFTYGDLVRLREEVDDMLKAGQEVEEESEVSNYF